MDFQIHFLINGWIGTRHLHRPLKRRHRPLNTHNLHLRRDPGRALGRYGQRRRSGLQQRPAESSLVFVQCQGESADGEFCGYGAGGEGWEGFVS